MSSKVIGAKEIEALLKQMPERVAKNVTLAALRAGGRVIIRGARQRVPVDSGLTRSKIGLKAQRRPSTGKAAISIGVRGGAAMVKRQGRSKPVKANAARSAHLVEFGTKKMAAQPFLRPALEEEGAAAIAAIGKALGRGVEREATRLAAGRTSFRTGRRVR